MRFLKQNTATRVTVGPFLDVTDAKTPEVALTATNEHITFVVDAAGVPTLVIDTTATASGGNNDFVHITNDNAGYYDLELTAAQTNYVGRAVLGVNYVTDHLPVFHEFMLVPAAIYDSFFGSTLLTVNTTQISGDSTAADNAEAFFDGTGYAGTNNVIPTVTTLTGHTAQTGDAFARLGAPAGASVSADIAAVKAETATIVADTAELQTDWANGGRLDLLLDTAAAGGSAASYGIVHEGTAQSATGTTLVLASGAAFANDELIGATILITGGTGVGQARIITDYVGATDTATVDTWTTTPSGTITYKVFGTPPASATSVPAVNVVQVGGSTTDVSALATNVAAILVDTGTTLDGKLNTIDDFLDTEVAAILAAVDTEVAAILADTNELQTDWANGGRLDLLLDGAASAGDPWTTSLPGAYGAGTAGYIVGTNVNATISSRASQTSVDTVDDLLDTELAAVKTVVDAVKVKTDYLPSATAGAAGGVFIAGSNAATTVNITGNVTGNLSGSVGSVTGLTAADVGAIKTKTDQLTFTVSNQLDANLQSVNDVALVGDGGATPWGPA